MVYEEKEKEGLGYNSWEEDKISNREIGMSKSTYE